VTSRLFAGTVAALALLVMGCGSESRTEGSAQARERSRVEIDRDRGFRVQLPSGWVRASGRITPQITDPLEILTLATRPVAGADPHGTCQPGSRPALAAFTEKDALVTLQESGRGALRINYRSHPPRPDRFRPENFPHGSTFTDCLVGELPVEDHWFGFADEGRAFHVLVIIGRAAPKHVRDEAWSILDRLRFDPDVRPDWQASPLARPRDPPLPLRRLLLRATRRARVGVALRRGPARPLSRSLQCRYRPSSSLVQVRRSAAPAGPEPFERGCVPTGPCPPTFGT
jgi:hypothetical protein